MGYVLFFKENTIHKIYGSRPADYQVVSTQCRGVAKGASRSLSVINETLYYLSTEGVMAWDGSLPVNISGRLGPFLADEREVCSRRGLGCPVLPLCQGQQRGDSAAGV